MMPQPKIDEPEIVRLWSFQRASIVPALSAPDGYRPTWDCAPENWRLAYEWMAKRWAEATRRTMDGPPIWCWHSCEGRLSAAPTVGTALALLSECELEEDFVTIELAVPAELVLLSSYHVWNWFLEYVIDKKCLPRMNLQVRQMFAQPLLKHEIDNVQAVIPFIDPLWVRGVTDLKVGDRPLRHDRDDLDCDAPIVPSR